MDGSRIVTATRAFEGRTGRGVRVAVIDSGVNAAHSHIVRVAGGATIGETVEPDIYVDLLGHGTAVMAAIQEKAPEAEYFALRVFYSSLRTHVEYLVRAMEWCVEHGIHVVNLSLGTPNRDHGPRFGPVLERFRESRIVAVSANEANGVPALPGSLPGVIGVSVDATCPREVFRYRTNGDRTEYLASPYPRSLPGVPRERNLQGISFAVANMSGFVARACEARATQESGALDVLLRAEADRLSQEAGGAVT